jgi:choline dehydrogenase-like flavoprotein
MPRVSGHDCVIVGAGSAGCVLANRLSEDPDRTEVLGLKLDSDRVTGVRIRRGRRGEEAVDARREVPLCAGAIGSPQILQLSGIGAAEELRAVGITPRHELPGTDAPAPSCSTTPAARAG